MVSRGCRMFLRSRIGAGAGARCYSEKAARETSSVSPHQDIIYTQEHYSLRDSLRKVTAKGRASGLRPRDLGFIAARPGFLEVSKNRKSQHRRRPLVPLCESWLFDNRDVCSLLPDPGPCKALIQRFYYNRYTQNCEEFDYGGCIGNANNFETLKECTGHCQRLKKYGGLGLDFSYNIAVAEELGNIPCGGIPMAIGVQSDMATPALARFGSDELKRQFLTPTIAGDMVACLGVSEIEAGSDVANIKTKAVKHGDDYIINGGKMWITNGCQADWMCLLANTSDGPLHKSKSLICLPMKLPGIHVAKKIDKLGMRSSDTAQIFFEDVRVPRKYLIGEEGMGFTYQMLQFQEERMWAVAGMLAPMQNIIQETIEYTRQRKVFDQPVLHNQTVHFRLAELETEIELVRSLLYRCVAQYVQGNDTTKLASMAKLKAARLVREVTDSCLQFWGGMGFTNEVLVSRLYRDMRLMSIGAGADEVMLSIICKYMGTIPGKK
ncbi:probable acyl-CoA dehydrogenase 6 [Rhincodon typus]|uniref:probable acyl-CoA dehydrogenase 6 n=1 Tax=Rhincodon typus TaxID=259920 RepID=UPI00202DC2A8|nr:probable acyl-CoA dehydrogenase 6 [Rhincodon typus]